MTEKVERAHDSVYGGATAAPKKLTVPDVVAMKRDGKRSARCPRTMATVPSSSGWRSASRLGR